MSFPKSLLLIVAAGALVVGAFVYSGVYPVGADDTHTRLIHWLLETLRERSIARAAAPISVPPLDDPDLLLAGGPDYNEMCAQCHLTPGRTETDLSVGLNPAPPNLAAPDGDHRHEPTGNGTTSARRQFWIIKHGIKASGMPALGPTHDDKRIWAMVAFLQRLPELTPAQYQVLTTRDPGQPAHGDMHAPTHEINGNRNAH